MMNIDLESDAGKASAGGSRCADLPTSTTGLLGSNDAHIASLSLFSQSTTVTASKASDIDQAQVNKLLDHVMRGEEIEAENMIKVNPQLLNHKGSGKEFHNDRGFKSITPFQYALWAMDWYMWDMMMRYMDHSEARMQLEELEGRGTEHGRQFNGFDSLINAYQVYIDKFDGWNWDHREQHWCKVVGGAQKALPVHVLQEYWRTDRTMDPTPDFKDKRGKDHGDMVEEISPRCGLSERWAVHRGRFDHVRGPIDPSKLCFLPLVNDQFPADQYGIKSLKKRRNKQYKTLRNMLRKLPLSTTQDRGSSVADLSHGASHIPLSTLALPSAKMRTVADDIDQEHVNKLLDLVMRGEQDEAEQMIKANPQLLNHKGRGKEFHNDRKFRSITPFQYALWSLDWYMWDMMMKYIEHSQARSQFEELESRGTEHGKQFDGFDRLINAYQLYIDKYKSWNYNQQVQHWCKVVGGAQRALPVHILQEYWRKDRSMEPTPDFKVKRGNDHDKLVEELCPRSGHSERWAVCRGRFDSVWGPGLDASKPSIAPNGDNPYLRDDQYGIKSLKKTRINQYKELRETLFFIPSNDSALCIGWGICV